MKVLVAALAALFAVGCASPRAMNSGRAGFFDRLSQGGPGQGRTPADESGSSEAHEAQVELVAKLKPSITNWAWPLADVKITSPFGRRGSDFHEGIDLRASVGTSVYAVDGGRVLYAGRRIRGYGQMVVLKHPSGLASLYAHNSKVLVRIGQSVRKGQKIAVSGKTGHAKGPHLHFEVRSGVAAIDPGELLADARPARPALPPALSPKRKARQQKVAMRYAKPVAIR